jgi:hypothetical protein
MMAKAAWSEDHKMISSVPWQLELRPASFQPEQRAFDLRIVESDIATHGRMLPEIG